LRAGRQWGERAARLLDVAPLKVDAHNIVSCWLSSGKKEFAAYTLPPAGVAQASKAAFLEELIVRSELADNFCVHQPARCQTDHPARRRSRPLADAAGMRCA